MAAQSSKSSSNGDGHWTDCQPGAFSPTLKQQAIDRAQIGFSLLPRHQKAFQECIDSSQSLVDVVRSAVSAHQEYKSRRSTRILDAFQKHSLWLQNMSSAVDVAVQVQAGIACPVWAPLKFLLQVSGDHFHTAEQVLRLIQTVSEALPRLEVYEKLGEEPILQLALLEIFTDIVEFSVRAVRYFKRSSHCKYSLNS